MADGMNGWVVDYAGDDTGTGETPSTAQQKLAPLKKGKGVAFKVRDPAGFKKRHYPEPMLALMPLQQMGAKKDFRLLIAMEGHGAQIIDTTERVKTVDLFKVGLSFKASGILADELNKLFAYRQRKSKRKKRTPR